MPEGVTSAAAGQGEAVPALAFMTGLSGDLDRGTGRQGAEFLPARLVAYVQARGAGDHHGLVERRHLKPGSRRRRRQGGDFQPGDVGVFPAGVFFQIRPVGIGRAQALDRFSQHGFPIAGQAGSDRRQAGQLEHEIPPVPARVRELAVGVHQGFLRHPAAVK